MGVYVRTGAGRYQPYTLEGGPWPPRPG